MHLTKTELKYGLICNLDNINSNTFYKSKQQITKTTQN